MKPGTLLPMAGAMIEVLTLGAVLSTVTLNEALALLVALSTAVSVYALAPAARTALAVSEALRYG